MFSYKLLIVLVSIAASLSIPVSQPSANEPERCCVPKQYSAKIGLSTGISLPDGKVYTSFARYNFSYDADRGMVGIKGVSYSVPDGQPTKLWIIENVKTGQTFTYIIDTKQCDKSTNPIHPMNCIPQDATYIDSTLYGYGDKQIVADTWLVKLDGAITYSTVSRGDCIPLTGDVFTEDPKMVSGLTTTDYIPRIIDPNIFDIPAECKNLF